MHNNSSNVLNSKAPQKSEQVLEFDMNYETAPVTVDADTAAHYCMIGPSAERCFPEWIFAVYFQE